MHPFLRDSFRLVISTTNSQRGSSKVERGIRNATKCVAVSTDLKASFAITSSFSFFVHAINPRTEPNLSNVSEGFVGIDTLQFARIYIYISAALFLSKRGTVVTRKRDWQYECIHLVSYRKADVSSPVLERVYIYMYIRDAQ